MYTSLTAPREINAWTPMAEPTGTEQLTRCAAAGVRCAYERVLDLPCRETAVIARHSVRVCKLLVAVALMGHRFGTDLQAQVGISSRLARVSLVVRAPSHADMPRVSAPRVIGRRGDLREAAVRLNLRANSGYRLVARNSAGSTSRVWIRVADHDYQELIPGRALTLPGERHGSSEREVRYLTDGSTWSAELPVRFELVIDPVI